MEQFSRTKKKLLMLMNFAEGALHSEQHNIQLCGRQCDGLLSFVAE